MRTLSYGELFDRRLTAAGLLPVAALFVALVATSQVAAVCRTFLMEPPEAWSPRFLVWGVVDAAITAVALVWASGQFRSAWLSAALFGVMNLLCNALTAVVVSLSPQVWFDWRQALLGLLWGMLVLGGLALAVRLAGLHGGALATLSIVAWSIFGGVLHLVHSGWAPLQAFQVTWPLSGLIFGLGAFAGLAWRRRRYGLPGQAAAPEGPSRISKGFFLLSVGGGLGLGSLLVLGSLRTLRFHRPGQALLGLLLLLYGAVVMMVLVHRMWGAIQDGHARTSPGRALGFLFIPLFNLYWSFQVFRGFAKDYNGYLARHGIDAPRLPAGLFLAYSILALLTWIPLAGVAVNLVNLFLAIAMAALVCDAVNALGADAPEQAAGGYASRAR